MMHASESNGYRHCACRDCFEIVVGGAGELCFACEGSCGPEFSTVAECQAERCFDCGETVELDACDCGGAA